MRKAGNLWQEKRRAVEPMKETKACLEHAYKHASTTFEVLYAQKILNLILEADEFIKKHEPKLTKYQ